MLKKDYLLAQITELAKKFAYLIKRKSEGDDIWSKDGFFPLKSLL